VPIWVKMKRMAQESEEGSIQSQEGAGLLQRRTPGLKVSIVGEPAGDGVRFWAEGRNMAVVPDS
jgi:hypothetical protein